MKKLKNFLKAVAFTVIFVLLFQTVSDVMTSPAGDTRNYQWIAGFYEEPEQSLDAVYLGSSNCYSFWNSLVAWEEYGIAVYPYACNSQPLEAAEYLIKEARKTQPDALYIINLNALGEKEITEARMHYLLDYMPFSFNKLAMTYHLSKLGGYSFSDSLEFYLPMVRYHSRWKELTDEDYNHSINGLKGAATYYNYLGVSTDISDKYVVANKRESMSKQLKACMESLLSYCTLEKVNVLFVTVPRAERDADSVMQLNALNRLVSNWGFETLHLTDEYDEIGINLSRDYYNSTHTNIHGSIKYTHFLSEYLIKEYGFADKRGEAAYSSWDAGWENYQQRIAPYVIDFELDAKHRDFDIAAPAWVAVESASEGVRFYWAASERADGYLVYRKSAGIHAWEYLATTPACEFIDQNGEENHVYTVVPYYEKDGETYYGDFSHVGIKFVPEQEVEE